MISRGCIRLRELHRVRARQWTSACRGVCLCQIPIASSSSCPSQCFHPVSRRQGSFSGPQHRFQSTNGVLQTLQTVADWIQESVASQQANIVVLCGAGISVSAGIPDFRTPGTGLYDNLQRYNLPFPEAIFDLDFYQQRPRAFTSLAREIWPGQHSPTVTHSFLALLEQKKSLLRVYTQNIDGLEFLGGVSADRLVECHGNFRTASCTRCGAEADIEQVKTSILGKEVPEPPLCKRCNGYVKPDIVFFGESLPNRMNILLGQDLPKARLLLIMGTSLQVAPVSQIPDWVRRDCRRVLLNRQFVGNLAIDHGDEESRDIFHSDDCDGSVLAICRALGWENELQRQHESSTRVQPDV